MSASGADLIAALGRLAKFATTDFDSQHLLSQLCEAAASALDVDGVGVMAVDLGRTRFIRASHPDAETLERLQEALQTGPSRDAVDAGTSVHCSSFDEMTEFWPDLAAEAARFRIQSVLVLPMLSRGECWGSLDLYWRRPHTLDAREHAAGQLLADVAVGFLVLAADRAQSTVTQQLLATQVLHDQLTGLPNRGLVHELIDHAIAATERHGRSVAVLFVDLDSFKTINDTHGHLAGDLVLQEVARRLRTTVRTGDCVGRLSGDEFLILCEDLAESPESVTVVTGRLAERVGAAIAEPISVFNTMVTVTASIGIAVTDDHPTAAELIHEADTAMYRAKARLPGWVRDP